MLRVSCLLTLILGMVGLPSWSIAQSKNTKKGNQLFKEERYAEAAKQYELALETKPSKSVAAKLSRCYIANNRLSDAQKVLSSLVTDDRARTEYWWWYSQVWMGMGKYDSAQFWLQKYSLSEPDDANALKLLQSMPEIARIQPYFAKARIDTFPYNTSADENGGVFFQQKILFSSDREKGSSILKEKSGWTGRDYLRIYEAQAASIHELNGKINELNKNSSSPTLPDGASLLYFSKNYNVSNKQDLYPLQLYQAEGSSSESRWKNISILPFCSPEYNYMHPSISFSGDTLLFTSDKAGGVGGTDIWMTIRLQDGSWSKPSPLDTSINTDQNEGFPFLDANGNLYFCSKGHLGFGGYDVYLAKATKEGWEKPINLGTPINSPADDVHFSLKKDGCWGILTSARQGGDDDLYLIALCGQPEVYWDTLPKVKESSENVVAEPKVNPEIVNMSTEEVSIEEKHIKTPKKDVKKKGKKSAKVNSRLEKKMKKSKSPPKYF